MGAMNRIINGVHPDVHLETGDCVIFHLKLSQAMKIISFTKLNCKRKDRNDFRGKCICSCVWPP